MRIDMINIGSVCRCKHGYLGVVASVKRRCLTGDCGVEYIGVRFNGKPWRSSDPEKVAENLNEYISRLISKTK